MNCNEIRELFSLNMDGLLMEADRMKLENHLLTCDACKREYDSILFVSMALKDLPPVEIPEEFDARLRKELVKINKIDLHKNKKKKWLRYSSMAAIFLVGIFSIAMYNNMEVGNSNPIGDITPAASKMKVAPAVEDATKPSTINLDLTTNQNPCSIVSPSPSPDPNANLNMLYGAPELAEPLMRLSSPVFDEEMENYNSLLEEMNNSQGYRIIDWSKDSLQVYTINVELEIIDGSGTVSYEAIRYMGQDGKLWKIE